MGKRTIISNSGGYEAGSKEVKVLCRPGSTLGDGIEENLVSWLVMEISQIYFLAEQWRHQCKLIHLYVVLSYTSEVSWGRTHCLIWSFWQWFRVPATTTVENTWLMPEINSRRYSCILSLSALIQFTWEPDGFFVMVSLHIMAPEQLFDTSSAWESLIISTIICNFTQICIFKGCFYLRLFKVRLCIFWGFCLNQIVPLWISGC